mgnify:CR=1 FL=1
MNNRQSYHYKTEAQKAAEEEAAQRKLEMQRIAKGTAKRMLNRRAQQAENKERRETGQRKRNKAKRNERHPGMTTAEIRAKREAKGKGKFAKKKSGGAADAIVSGISKSERKANRTAAERKENRRKKGRGRFAK